MNTTAPVPTPHLDRIAAISTISRFLSVDWEGSDAGADNGIAASRVDGFVGSWDFGYSEITGPVGALA